MITYHDFGTIVTTTTCTHPLMWRVQSGNQLGWVFAKTCVKFACDTGAGVTITAHRLSWQEQQRHFCEASIPNYPPLYSEAYESKPCLYPTSVFISDPLQMKWSVPQLVLRSSQVSQAEQITEALMYLRSLLIQKQSSISSGKGTLHLEPVVLYYASNYNVYWLY